MPKALSFHAYKNYQECPQRYDLQNVQYIKPPAGFDEYNTVYGSVVQKAFEHFYNDEIWRKGRDARKTILDMVPAIFKSIVNGKTIIWRDHPQTAEEILADCIVAVNSGIDVIKTHRLLTSYSRAELPIYTHITSNAQIMGRLDFIIKRDDKVLIIDGKGSAGRDKKLDRNQLYWYALLYYLRFQTMPDSLWYWFYRFPEDPLLQVEFDVATLKQLKDSILETLHAINSKKFAPTPGNSCFFCPYKANCIAKANHFNKIIVPKSDGLITEIGFE
jgi:CRISPR/Cas system-associated exonuclease Cas4 (RecB family)